MRKRIGVDVDEVIAQLHKQWIKEYNEKYHTNLEELDRWEDWGSNPRLMELLTPEMYDRIDPYDGALEAAKEIVSYGHTLVYISSCFSEDSFRAKMAWLIRHGFNVGDWEFYGVGDWSPFKSKADIKTDWLVDDHIGNLVNYTGYKILVTRRHNQREIFEGKRVKSLRDVAQMLKFLEPTEVTVASDVKDEDFYAAMEQARGTITLTNNVPLFPVQAQERKNIPICTGVLDYFPLAIAEVARVSKAGNDQHNPGQPLHWAKEKSTDHPDCVARHLIERGKRDSDGQRHSAKAAWRALAMLQIELEEELAAVSA